MTLPQPHRRRASRSRALASTVPFAGGVAGIRAARRCLRALHRHAPDQHRRCRRSDRQCAPRAAPGASCRVDARALAPTTYIARPPAGTPPARSLTSTLSPKTSPGSERTPSRSTAQKCLAGYRLIWLASLLTSPAATGSLGSWLRKAWASAARCPSTPPLLNRGGSRRRRSHEAPIASLARQLALLDAWACPSRANMPAR
jgi:hypothetical protein